MKRIREDGQISREEYELDASTASTSTSINGFGTAPSSVLAQRNILSARSPRGRSGASAPERDEMRDEFLLHVHALNKSFAAWVKSQQAATPSADLTAGMQDYLEYMKQLERRFMRRHGAVLTFGSGDCGQLALGTDDKDLMVPYPRVVYSLRDKRVVMVACGGLHNVVCTANGSVYTWGCNDDGSLGRLTKGEGEEQVPARVELPHGEKIIQVAAGDCQSMAVSLSGAVYGWGCYKDKEGKQWFEATRDSKPTHCKRAQKTPQRVPGLNSVSQVACGASYNIAMLADGSVMSWGIGECGELSRAAPPLKGSDGEYSFEPISRMHLTPGPMHSEDSVSKPFSGVKAIGCGLYHAFLIMAIDAKVFAVGLNNYGQLGLGDEKNRDRLVHVKALDGYGVTEACGGSHHSLVLCGHSGQLLAFGRKDSGQLGVSDDISSPGTFENLPIRVTLGGASGKATSIVCGANHNLCLTDKNEIYTWGYGDMYALGHGNDKDQSRPRKINVAKAGFESLEVFDMGGGGQHSAIVGDVRAGR
jgi:regulator of chromosome condensation